MKRLKSNLYFTSSAVAFGIGILTLLFLVKGDVVMFFSANRHPYLDTFFFWVTNEKDLIFVSLASIPVVFVIIVIS